MAAVDRLLSAVGLQRRSAAAAPSRARAPVLRAGRSFAAAEVGNLTASFAGAEGSLNDELQYSLRIMRARSRKLARDNDYVKKFLRMVQNHVVGPAGFALSVPCLRNDGTIDTYDKSICEASFARWSKLGTCEVTGKLSWVALQRLAALVMARDGEVLIRRVRGKEHNAYGYALQLIDPVLLDDTYRADFADGRRIRMGVEVNAWGRPIAYHILKDEEMAFGGIARERVPASEIWHLFIQDEPSQVRGVPWIHSAMRRLNDIGGYEQAAIIAARVGASSMGFYVPPTDSADNPAILASGTQTDPQGEEHLVRDATPGTFEKLPPGYDFKTFDPDYPHANFDGFIKAMLRGVASGIGADYNTLSNDLENVNYSSIRSGKLETQDEWMCLQAHLRAGLHERLWPEWLEMAFVSGQLDPLPVSKFEKYNVAQWQGRRWPWVDPEKDANSRVIELRNGLTSYSAVIRELGRDPEAVWRELEKDRERLRSLGLPLDDAATTTNTEPAKATSAGASTSGGANA